MMDRGPLSDSAGCSTVSLDHGRLGLRKTRSSAPAAASTAPGAPSRPEVVLDRIPELLGRLRGGCGTWCGRDSTAGQSSGSCPAGRDPPGASSVERRLRDATRAFALGNPPTVPGRGARVPRPHPRRVVSGSSRRKKAARPREEWCRFGVVRSGPAAIRKPDQVRVLDSASDFARVTCHGGADETAEGKIGGRAKSDQACADEGPGSAGQDSEAEEEDREDAEGGGRDQDSPVPKTAGQSNRTGSQARGAGTTRR